MTRRHPAGVMAASGQRLDDGTLVGMKLRLACGVGLPRQARPGDEPERDLYDDEERQQAEQQERIAIASRQDVRRRAAQRRCWRQGELRTEIGAALATTHLGIAIH